MNDSKLLKFSMLNLHKNRLFPNRKFMKQTVAPRSLWLSRYVRKPPTAFRLCPLLLAQAAKAHGVPAPASTLIEGLVSPTGKPYATYDMVSLARGTPEINDGAHDKFPPFCFLQVAFWALMVVRQKDDKVSTDTLFVIRDRVHPWDPQIKFQPPWDKLEWLSISLRVSILRILFSSATYKMH